MCAELKVRGKNRGGWVRTNNTGVFYQWALERRSEGEKATVNSRVGVWRPVWSSSAPALLPRVCDNARKKKAFAAQMKQITTWAPRLIVRKATNNFFKKKKKDAAELSSTFRPLPLYARGLGEGVGHSSCSSVQTCISHRCGKVHFSLLLCCFEKEKWPYEWFSYNCIDFKLFWTEHKCFLA